MLEQETRVRDVEALPVRSKVELRDVALPEVDQIRLAVIVGQTCRRAELLDVALDPHHPPAGHRAGHGARKLAEAGAEVEDALVAAQVHLAQHGLVEEDVVEEAEAPLLGFGGAVNVNGHEFRISNFEW